MIFVVNRNVKVTLMNGDKYFFVIDGIHPPSEKK